MIAPAIGPTTPEKSDKSLPKLTSLSSIITFLAIFVPSLKVTNFCNSGKPSSSKPSCVTANLPLESLVKPLVPKIFVATWSCSAKGFGPLVISVLPNLDLKPLIFGIPVS